jgi:hypothetical protein
MSTTTGNTTFNIEAWYKSGFSIYSGIHGSLTLDDRGITFAADSSKSIFTLAFSEVEKVLLAPGRFTFKSTPGSYTVWLYDMSKQSRITMTTGGFQFTEATERIQAQLREHNIKLQGDNKPGTQRMIIILGIIGGLVILYFLGAFLAK